MTSLTRLHAPALAQSARRPGAAGLVLVWGLACALCAGAAHADKSDRLQPLNFAADSARVDDNQHLNVLSGNVEITKGSIILRAAQVEVRQGADSTQTAVATGGQGGRAFFRQRREGLDQFIEGEAERVEYDGRADLVRFSGRAVMRRLEGGSVVDEVVGQTIVYDNKTEVFQVVGGGGPASPTGRVRGVIGPRKDTGTSAGTAPAAAKGKAPAGGAAPAASSPGAAADPSVPDDSTRLLTTRTLSRPVLESQR